MVSRCQINERTENRPASDSSLRANESAQSIARRPHRSPRVPDPPVRSPARRGWRREFRSPRPPRPLPALATPAALEPDADPWPPPARAGRQRQTPRFPARAGAVRRPEKSPPPRPMLSFCLSLHHSSPDERGRIPSISSSSSGSRTGDEIRYTPLAHFPKSMVLQCSLQKGKSASFTVTICPHVGQRRLLSFLPEGLIATFPCCQTADNSAYQIVILRLSNFALVKMPGVQLVKGSKIVDKDLAVDLRRLMLRAALP